MALKLSTTLETHNGPQLSTYLGATSILRDFLTA